MDKRRLPYPPPALVGLLHMLPKNGASWTPERRNEFLTAFELVLDYSVPIVEWGETAGASAASDDG
jgi:hypothetical protein